MLGGTSAGSYTSEAALDAAAARRNEMLREARLPLPWDAATAREVVELLLTDVRLTDPAVLDAVLQQCRKPEAAASRDVMRLRQLFTACKSAFRYWDGPGFSLHGGRSPDLHDEERMFSGFLGFLRSDARHFMARITLVNGLQYTSGLSTPNQGPNTLNQVPSSDGAIVAEHAQRTVHIWRIYRGEAAVLAGDPEAVLAHAEALRQAFDATSLQSLWGISDRTAETGLLRTEAGVLFDSKRALAGLPGFGADFARRLIRRNPGLLTLGGQEVETRWRALVAATDLRPEWQRERRMWMELDAPRTWSYITGRKPHDIGTVLEGADEERTARLQYIDAMCGGTDIRCGGHTAAELLLMRPEMLDRLVTRDRYAVAFEEWRCRL